MTLMRAATANGYVLTYDTDDVEDFKIEVPSDVIDVTKPEDKYVHRVLGQTHLDVHIDFKNGRRPLWVTELEAARPQLTEAGDILTAALNAEDVPAELASRIWNRFFFGGPEGLAGGPREVGP